MGERVGQDIAHFQRFAELSVSARMKFDMGVLTAGRVQMKAWVEHSLPHNKKYITELMFFHHQQAHCSSSHEEEGPKGKFTSVFLTLCFCSHQCKFKLVCSS
jgi:hypothetical protein